MVSLEEFIKYVKEEFGFTIICEKSNNHDTFEIIFRDFENPLVQHIK